MMAIRTPDVIAELSSIETDGGHPLEPEPAGKFSAVLGVGSRKFAAHLMLDANLLSGMTKTVPIAFDDFADTEGLFPEGATFTIADRGCRCAGRIVTVLPRHDAPARAPDWTDAMRNTDFTAAPAAPTAPAPAQADWMLPDELAQEAPRACRPSASYLKSQAMWIALGVVLLALFVFLPAKPLIELHALKSLRDNGTAVAGKLVHSEFVQGNATTRGSTPSHYLLKYSYKVTQYDAGGKPHDTLHYGDGRINIGRNSIAAMPTGDAITVVYDPADPGRSVMANEGRLKDYAFIMALAICTLLAFIGIPSLLLWIQYTRYRGQKHLLTWGRIARANLVEKSPPRNTAGSWSATYAFRDARGAYIKLTQNIKPQEDADCIEDHCIVLFDPGERATAAPYPLKLVTLLPS